MANTILYIVVAVIVIGGIFWFMRNSEDSGSLSETSSQNTTGTNTGVIGMKSTLGGIFDDPGNYQCDYNQVSQQSRSTNVVYISGGKLRAEFRTQTATSTTLSLAFYDGTYLYVWEEGKSTGVRTQPRTISDLPKAIPEDITSGRILGSGLSSVSWDCHDWLKDPAKLVKPTYVKF